LSELSPHFSLQSYLPVFALAAFFVVVALVLLVCMNSCTQGAALGFILVFQIDASANIVEFNLKLLFTFDWFT